MSVKSKILLNYLQPLGVGKQIQPVQNVKFEAYQMYKQGRNYNTSVAERNLQGTNASLALQRMIVPEVLVFFFK